MSGVVEETQAAKRQRGGKSVKANGANNDSSDEGVSESASEQDEESSEGGAGGEGATDANVTVGSSRNMGNMVVTRKRRN